MIKLEQKTHKLINKDLCGIPIEIRERYSRVNLKSNSDMILDETGLIHGGFIFSLADYAAMLAINHPNTVLGGANVRFIKPVRENEMLIAEAQYIKDEGKKQIVDVNVKKGDEVVFRGEFFCYSPDHHVLRGGDNI